MNARDYTAIRHPLPLAHPATKCIPAPCPQPLDDAIVQPDYEGMDDVGSYAEQQQFVSKHPLRPTWWQMLRRCENPEADSYPRYGGRGIKVCAAWHDFETFVADMGPRPDGMSLDRINSDGDYEPGNCRWASNEVQNRNRSDNKFIEFNGERLIQKDWAARTGINECTIARRLAQGWSVEDALTTPPIKGYNTRIRTAASFAVTNARFDRLTDDQIEQLTDEADQAASAEQLEDVQHDLRVEWRHALDNQHALSTPKLPTVEAGKLVMVPVTELVGQLMDSCRAVQLLCDALRTGELNALHLQLRTDWIEGNAQALADLGWTA